MAGSAVANCPDDYIAIEGNLWKTFLNTQYMFQKNLILLGAGGECGDRDDTVGINRFCKNRLHFQNAATVSVPICGKLISSTL